MIKLRFFISINIQRGGTLLCFKQYKLMDRFFTHTSIFRFIQNIKVPILFNRQQLLCVSMGKDRGGLIFGPHCSWPILAHENKGGPF